MKVNIITSRSGGPYNWGKNLSYELNNIGIKAKHRYKIFDILKSLLFRNHDFIHTTIPLFFFKSPFILTIHGDFFKEKKLFIKPYIKAIDKAKIITTPSLFIKEKLELMDAVIIPNGVKVIDSFSPNNDGSNDKVKLLTIMNFEFKDKVEGIEKIVDIISRLEIKQNLEYNIVGGGEYLEDIRNKIKMKNVNFLGFVEDITPLLKNSDVFVYYSFHDNFPIVFLEAMVYGLPVITNNVGATKEIFNNGHDGFFTDDDVQFSNHLVNLINNKEYRLKIGENAIKKVKERFSWKKLVYNYKKIYGDLVENKYYNSGF